MEEGLLSIIIISYKNSSLVVKRAIQSAREQDYENHEIILVDANEEGSDYSLGLQEDMEAYPEIAVVSCPCKNGEFAMAKNKGAFLAKGEYIGYLMASDAWNPKCTSKQIEILREEKETGFVFCHCWKREEDAFSTEYRNPPPNMEEDDCEQKKDSLFQESFYSISQVIFRRDVFFEMKGFDPNISGQDEYDMWLRVAEKYRIVGIEQNLVCNYIEKETLKKTDERVDVIGYLQLYSKHREMYDKDDKKKLALYKKIAECYKDAHDYLQWIKYRAKIIQLEQKLKLDKENDKKPKAKKNIVSNGKRMVHFRSDNVEKDSK